MAARRPLTLVNGKLKEVTDADKILTPSDTIPWNQVLDAPTTYESATAPLAPAPGDIWIHTTTGTKYDWIGSTWVELGNASPIIGVDSTIPVYLSATQPLITGQYIWFQTDIDGSISVWINED
jgi:hypothetical protein